MAHNIDLHIQWIPRELYTQADFISKRRDCNDWQITRDVFQQLDSTCGPHTLDCFASFYNAKIERLFSRFWNPGCLGVDAFFQQWTGENCLLVPAVNIVTKVLSYMCSQNCVGTLAVPAWPSAAFWPVLWQKYQNKILAYKYYKGNEACTHGRNSKSIIGSPDWNRYIIAVRLSLI